MFWDLPRQWLQEYVDVHLSRNCTPLRCVQEKILFALLPIAALSFLWPCFVGMRLAFKQDLWPIIVIDTFAYSVLVILVMWRSLPYLWRVVGLLGVIQLLAMSLLFITGNHGSGWLWLFLPPVLAALLLNSRVAYWIVAFDLIVFLIVGFGGEYLPAFQRIGVLRDGGVAVFVVISSNYLALSVLVLFIAGRLLRGLEKVLRTLKAQSHELKMTQEVTVDAMAFLAEYRDMETGNHITRTRHYVGVLARQLQKMGTHPELDDQTVELLSQSAPLHDIGKIGVPDEILLKPGRLTEEEFEIMKRHTVYGRNALRQAENKLGSNHFLRLAAEIAGTHHEKWDGSGYPDGLKGEAIPLSGRIMAVADVYDALISKRVYKEPFTHEEAVAYIKEHRGTQFDPQVVDAFLAVAERFKAIAQSYAN